MQRIFISNIYNKGLLPGSTVQKLVMHSSYQHAVHQPLVCPSTSATLSLKKTFVRNRLLTPQSSNSISVGLAWTWPQPVQL